MGKVENIIRLLKKRYPGVFYGSSISKNPFKVLIGTILSHQTQDERTIKGERRLFSVYDTPQKLARAPESKIRQLIRSVGIYKVKAKRIKEVSRQLLERFGGKVPQDYEQLISLPGVGRKTANIVFTHAFGHNDLIAVDTHVHKIANRLGLVKTKYPDKTEQELYKNVPRRYWSEINSLFVQHGQTICRASPRCDICPLIHYCNYYKANNGVRSLIYESSHPRKVFKRRSSSR